MAALNGVCMELDDCAFPLLKGIVPTSSLEEGFRGVNWALLVGAVPRKQGMERKDLLGINGKIFTGQGNAIAKNAASDVRVLVVGNPCNTNALIAANNAPGVPKERFFAMTALDENRAKTQLAQKASVDVTAVTNLAIWGNHSATMYPDYFNAKIQGRPVPEVIGHGEWLEKDFIATVQQRGAAIIKARGLRAAATPPMPPSIPCTSSRIRRRQRLVQCGRAYRWQLWHREGPHLQLSHPLQRQPVGNCPGRAPERLQQGENRRHRKRAKGGEIPRR